MKDKQRVRICVPICTENIDQMMALAHSMSDLATILELRLDCLQPRELEQAQLNLSQTARALKQPVIITFRATAEGGHRLLTYEDRLSFWREQTKVSGEALFDIEFDLIQQFLADDALRDRFPWARIICSYHNFDGTPHELEKIYEAMSSTPAQVIKIAVQAQDVVDCLSVFNLLDRAAHEHRELIAVSMGDAGVPTRILGPSRGAWLTYGSAKEDSATAPGQITAEKLSSVYRIRDLTADTQIFGLVGLPVRHSFSPQMHNAAFAATAIDAVYLPFEVHSLPAFFKRMVNPQTRELDWKLRGLSITAPHKSSVIQLLDWIEPRAKEINAVNTVVIEENKLRGYNTDADGFLEPLQQRFGSLRGARVAVIGAGGAASAAVWSLRQEGAAISLFVRDVEKARAFAERFGVSASPIASARFADFDIVVNATPIGTAGDLSTQFVARAEQLAGAKLVYDLIYNPTETELMREARLAGCEVLGGLKMLIAQARLQFKLWTGRDVEFAVMERAARLH